MACTLDPSVCYLSSINVGYRKMEIILCAILLSHTNMVLFLNVNWAAWMNMQQEKYFKKIVVVCWLITLVGLAACTVLSRDHIFFWVTFFAFFLRKKTTDQG